MTGTALSIAAFLALAGECAPGVAPETLADVARVESGLRPLAIGVNGAGGGAVRVATRDEAVARATALIAAGRSVDLGIMQINNMNLGWLGLTVADAFDPCRSIAAGARVLTAFSRYNTGSPSRGFANGYVARVVGAAATRDRAVQPAPTEPSPVSQEREVVPSWDVWAVAPAPSAPAPPASVAPEGAGATVVLSARRETP